jgi:hypothetical protein
MTVAPLNLTVTQIDSARRAEAEVEIDGVIGDGAILKAQGRVEPFSADMSARLRVSLKNFDVPTLSPYSGKYVGYSVKKGILSLTLDYTLSNRNVVGRNVVFLHKLTLGERVDSPDAVNLPLELAVALMTDRNDNINLNVPISGNLDDPRFQIGGILANTLIRLITSVVTSPLHVLGTLAGGLAADELRYVAFQAGSHALDSQEADKLARLAAALRQRPALLLDIEAIADKAVDGPALSEGETLNELARKRGKAIQERLTVEGKVEPERIFMVKEVIETAPTDTPVKSILSVFVR